LSATFFELVAVSRKVLEPDFYFIVLSIRRNPSNFTKITLRLFIPLIGLINQGGYGDLIWRLFLAADWMKDNFF